MQLTKKALIALIGVIYLAACQPAAGDVPAATATLRLLPSSTPTTIVSTLQIPEDTPVVPTATPFLHTVQAGETMIGIAVRYGVSLDELLLANPEVDPGFLTIGQELIIPGPEGSTVGALLPTPTPVALQPAPVTCYPIPSGNTWCITQVENTTSLPLEGMSLQINLLDEEGAILRQVNAYAPLDILYPDGVMPFAVILEESPGEIAGAYARILGAVPAQDVESRYPNLDIEETSVTYSADQRWAAWNGVVRLGTNIPGETGSIRAMLVAYDEPGRIVGYRLYEGEIGTAVGSEIALSMSVFSLSPDIDAVALFAEVEPQ